MDTLNLLYQFFSFFTGFITFVLLMYLSSFFKNEKLKYFSFFYFSFTMILLLNLVSLSEKSSEFYVNNTFYSIIHYLENPVLLLITIYTLPAFIHRLVEIKNPVKRDVFWGILSLSLLIINYTVSLFNSDLIVNKWRILIKDFTFIFMVLYCIILLYKYFISYQRSFEKSRLRNFIIIFSLLLPGIVSDTFFLREIKFKFFPFIYVITGVLFFRYFHHHYTSQMNIHNTDQSKFFPKDNLEKRYQLTSRESEVIRLLIEGKSNIELSEELYISVNTVKTHIRKIYNKLNVKNRLELINLVSTVLNIDKKDSSL